MVKARAHTTPFAPALIMGPDTVSYGELERDACLLARRLCRYGAGPETVVAVCLERSPAAFTAYLGIWKSGAAYLPLDPANPPERLRFMLEDADAPILVTRGSLAARLPKGRWQIVDLDSAFLLPAGGETPEGPERAEQLAYVIYTSGSTGRPKGVEIAHRNLSHLVVWHQRAFAISAADRASQVANLGFDAAVWEVWPYLAAGASVHFADEQTRKSPAALSEWMVAQGITIGFVPTAVAEQMIELDWPARTKLRALLTGADTLRRFPPSGLPFALLNNYGPTECTVVATSGVVEPGAAALELPAIGWPIDGALVHILDGEIHISGAGVGRGYRNNPALTESRFVPDPFSPEPGARMYKTGDLGRWLPDGRIAFLGRMDDQVKIRGYRVETGEIAAALNRHPSVRASEVMVREDSGGEKRLTAYIVAAPGKAAADDELTEFLRSQLPEYMLPDAFLRLAALPLTANGKVDRAALPAPEHAQSPPAENDAIERNVEDILAGLLHCRKIGPDENFFLLGGHSMLGAQVLNRVRDAFGIELSLRSLFEAPTPAALSVEIRRRLATGLPK